MRVEKGFWKRLGRLIKLLVKAPFVLALLVAWALVGVIGAIVIGVSCWFGLSYLITGEYWGWWRSYTDWVDYGGGEETFQTLIQLLKA